MNEKSRMFAPADDKKHIMRTTMHLYRCNDVHRL